MAVTLPQGTKEYLIVDVTDELNNLLTLDGTSPRYTVKDQGGAQKYTDQAGSNQGMKAYCMIDTNAGGLWAAGEYRLYVRFDALPEVPYLGPFSFEVSGD